MSLFEEYEKRTALTPRPLFSAPTQPVQQQGMNDKENLAMLKARYEAMKYEQKIAQFGQPKPYYKIRTFREIKHKPKTNQWAEAAQNLKTAYGTTSRFASASYKQAQRGYQVAKPVVQRVATSTKQRYERAGGVGGVKQKLRTFVTGSIYK
jgi:hypothetical protein